MMRIRMGRTVRSNLGMCLGLGCAVLLAALAVVLIWSSPALAISGPAADSPAQSTISGTFGRSLAIEADGSLWIWGCPGPFDEVVGDLLVPNPLGSGNDWAAVSDGWLLKSDGTLWSLDYDSGPEDSGDAAKLLPTPVRVGSDSDWAAVSGNLALKSDGTLWSSEHHYEHYSESEPAIDLSVITRLGADSDWVAVSCGGSYSFAIKTDGSLWCVEQVEDGNFDEDLEYGYITSYHVITRIGTENDWAAVCAGGGYSLALKTDGSLWSVEHETQYDFDEDTEQITFVVSRTITRIGTESDWAVVATSGDHSLALKTDGTLWAWGDNYYGQLGDGTSTDRHTPTRIGTSNQWRAVSTGFDHSLALRADGSLWAWGENYFGELGDGTTENRYQPTKVLTGVRVPQWSGGGGEASFSDVAGSPYEAAIYDLASRGVITGLDDGTFRPNDPVTRQQFAKMIVKAMLYPVTGSEVCPFTDVAPQVGTDPLYPSKYVAVCAQRKITQGRTPTIFGPEDNVTREQLITMAVRAAGLLDPPPGYAPSFTASQFSLEDHYRNARKAAFVGMLDGLEGMGPSYAFGAASTRGECAQILSNLLKKLES